MSVERRARCEVQRPRNIGGRRRRRALFEEAVAVIERCYDDDQLTVESLSLTIFSSRRQLQRSFAEAGTSVQERLYAVRMERAAELLHETSLPIAEVARRVGYRQPPHFAKAFRRLYGLTPSQWRSDVERGLGRQPSVSGLPVDRRPAA